jgi:succinoglycan biosynthesis protein ExoA
MAQHRYWQGSPAYSRLSTKFGSSSEDSARALHAALNFVHPTISVIQFGALQARHSNQIPILSLAEYARFSSLRRLLHYARTPVAEVASAVKAEPFVSIVMPALNEERYISAAIASIVPQSDSIQYELLVVDGGSTDATRAIVERIAESNARVRLIANDKRIQSAAMNIAAKLADPRSRYLVRADCHLQYPEGFVERCIKGLSAKQAASIVVPMRTEGTSCMQKAIAAAQNSRLGNGGSAHRRPGWSGFVDHGHHAAFNRNTFLELGGYDETFTHNEDAEFDKRLVQTGNRIYLDSEATVTYFPRSDLRALAKQYFSYGWGRASTLLKHKFFPRARQLLPVAVLLACIVALGLAVVDLRALLIPAAYVSLSLIWGASLAIAERDTCLVLSGIAAVVMHMSWAVGFLVRLLQPRFLR